MFLKLMFLKQSRIGSFFLSCSVVLCLLLLGCGGATDGPERYGLTGTITFDGNPIPNGMIRFMPDTKKGNRGPGAMTPIQNGTYQTPRDKGTVGGPMIVEITGFDGVPVEHNGELIDSGSPLFKPYRIEVDLPQESATRDFDVPRSLKITPSSR